ncbi:hypothetical protein [Nocardioides ultimimeridianus]
MQRPTSNRSGLVAALLALGLALLIAGVGAVGFGSGTAATATTATSTDAPSPGTTTIDDSHMVIGLRYFRVRHLSGHRYRIAWATQNAPTTTVQLVRRDGTVVRTVLTSHGSSGSTAVTVRHPRLRRLRVLLLAPDVRYTRDFRFPTS